MPRHPDVFTDAVIFRTLVPRRLAALVLAGSLAVTLSACVGSDATVSPADVALSSSPSAAQGDGTSPAPGRTVEATPPADVDGLRGVRIAAVVPSDGGAATRALREAVLGFAKENGMVVDEFVAADDRASLDEAFDEAVATQPHVVVGLGAGAVDVFGYMSSQFLDQDFLLIGAQLAEPTSNVTAVVWQGATSRGSGAPADGDLDDATITAARATDATSVGLSTVMSGVPGIVLHLPG